MKKNYHELPIFFEVNFLRVCRSEFLPIARKTGIQEGFSGFHLSFRGCIPTILVTQKNNLLPAIGPSVPFRGSSVGAPPRPDARRHSISAVSERPVTEQSWAFPELMSVSVTTAVSRSGSRGATFVFVAPQPMATPKMIKKQKFCEPQNEPLGAKGESRKSIPNWLYDAWCMSVWMSASRIMFDCQMVDHISFAVELPSPHVWLV